MRTDRLAVGALLLAGCAPAVGADLERVRSLSRAPALADVAREEIDPGTDAEVRKLLARPVDESTAVRIALLNNRALRATLRELGIARGQLVQAGLLPNPVLEIEKLPEQESELELAIEYDLTQALLAPMRARVAKAELEAERVRAAAAVVALGYEVRTAFHAAQAAQQRLAVARRALDAQAAGRDAAKALLDAGNVPALATESQAAAYERARVLVARLELEQAESRERLARLLGLHGPDTTFRLAGGLAPVPAKPPVLENAEARALDASLELAETRQRLEALARRSSLSRAEGWLPDVGVDVHGLKSKHAAGPGDAAEGQWRYGAGVTFSVPLFDRKQGATAATTAAWDALLERYHGAAVDIRSAAREAANRLRSAHARARQYQEVILPAQRRVTEQTLLQNNAMQVSLFQLLLARREELDAELAYVETLREYWSAAAALEALLAGKRPQAAPATAGASLGPQTEAAGGH